MPGLPELPLPPEDAEEAARRMRQEERKAGKEETKKKAMARRLDREARSEMRTAFRKRRAEGKIRRDRVAASRDRTKAKYDEEFTDAQLKFGKYKGRWMSEIIKENPGYLEWILEQEFSDLLKSVAAYQLERAGLVV